MHRAVRNAVPCLILAMATGAGAPTPAAAQSGGDGFLFRAPTVTATLRVGYSMPRASGDLFDFTTEQLTLSRSDFHAPAIAGELGIRLSDRIDATAYAGYAGRASTSEFRDWVDGDDRPIEQETELERASFTGGAKLYLTDRGRQVGRFAWIPATWMPYLGASAGVVWHRFEQRGDFVDFETLDIFRERFSTSGTSFTTHLAAGLDVSVGARMFLSAEGRYEWSEASAGGDFVGFEPLDLSGFQFSFGIGARL